jgi:release factor glutamine methyltransferase
MISGEQLFLWRCQAKQDAIAAGISPIEVDLLLKEIAGLDSLTLRLESFKERENITLLESLSQLNLLWERRLQERVPIQYLLGTVAWRNFKIKVSTDVLIPRPETELLVDLALKAIERNSELASGNWVDLGTGSGAIALGLADSLPQGSIHAVDRSPKALAIAKENARNLELESRIQFYQGCWWEPLEAIKGNVSGMISNPPYIPSDAIAHLQPEVVKHEPSLALDGGEDGFNYIRHLVEISPLYLRSGGIWLIESMMGQPPLIKQLLEEQKGYQNIQIFADLAGIERFIFAEKK